MNTNDLVAFVQNVEETGSEADQRVLCELLWLAYCRLNYTHSPRVPETIMLRHEWARLDAKLKGDGDATQ
jgi:hypothetical protein